MTPLPLRDTCLTAADINDPSRAKIVIRAPSRRPTSSTTKGRISLRSLKKPSTSTASIPDHEHPPEASSSSIEPKEIKGIKVVEGRVEKAPKYERSSSISSNGSSRTSLEARPLTAYAVARKNCVCRRIDPATCCRRCRLLQLADRLCTIAEGGRYVKSPLVG
ncbi:hypothetical protein BDN72DRAFT_877743 [Pluteus cervinus]|uniref:Uncharacterized protein n=1 Tax=Pluteus cervinus TaxID=181527 RepID=A0ACD3AZ58_9AGAR|nr:hypothetical protein BDN72DRAFT_877743 [Pluteus cervinus]